MRVILFQIVEWKQVGDRVHVTGRNCGADLQTGDTFSESSPWLSTDRQPVRLRVERILFYRSYINQIGPGLTAELELSGPDAAHLAGRMELHGRSSVELNSIEILGPGKSQWRRGG
jgi:hypothetical protein